jgi:hypothetical protein
MAYTKYSLTPGNNTAAPPDGAPEGMLPSAVNDTMRDMMAQIRDVGDGIRGGTYTMTAPVITGGSISGTTFSSSAATITGGTINGTTIGATTASTGAFSTLSATGVTTVQAGSVSAPAITTTGDTNTGIFFPAADTIAFTKGGAESIRISSNGDVGIGTTAPGTPLDVVSNAQAIGIRIRGRSADSYGVLEFTNNGVSAETGRIAVDSSDNIIFSNTGSITERMRIDGSGIVTMSAYGAGAATFNASGVISSVSDETWKIKDGVPTNPNAMLQKLEAGYWFYNEEKAPIFGKERQLGFYAQNVHEAIGEEAAPTPKEGKPWGYHDRSVLAITVMSLKNALTTIEELKQRLTALENK